MNPAAPVSSPLDAALAYAGLGLRVFPVHWPRVTGEKPVCSCPAGAACRNVGKHPMTEKGLHDGTTDSEIIRAWWRRWPEANIGIATGAESGIVVVDVDPGHGGQESLAALMEEHGEIAETVEAVSGSGGQHLYFRHPGTKLGNSAGKLGPGLDVRGDGGYIIAAPSRHYSGGSYSWSPRSSPTERAPIVLPSWMLGKLLAKPPQPAREPSGPSPDTARHWLGKALAEARVGGRNERCLWLACQLRDAGLSQREAEQTACDYADRCPGGDHPFTHAEAVACVRSAYSQSRREPAGSRNGQARGHSRACSSAEPEARPVAVPSCPSAELRDHIEAVIDGRVKNVAFAEAQALSASTQALLPGTVTVVVGDPGVGKTFLILQQMLFWKTQGIEVATFFVEKDRKFHTLRLLAQLEQDGRFVDYPWIAANPTAVRGAIAKHAATLDLIGHDIYSQDEKEITLRSLAGWIRQMASAGKRIIIIDPITAIAAGSERWEEDRRFVVEAQQIGRAHDASILLTSHCRRGVKGKPSLDDAALGTAYTRLSDTGLWIIRPAKPRRVRYESPCGTAEGRFTHFIQIRKARLGKGTGQELAFRFGDGLRYTEQGIVVEDLKDDGSEEDERAPMGQKKAKELASYAAKLWAGQMTDGQFQYVAHAFALLPGDQQVRTAIGRHYEAFRDRPLDVVEMVKAVAAAGAIEHA